MDLALQAQPEFVHSPAARNPQCIVRISLRAFVPFRTFDLPAVFVCSRARVDLLKAPFREPSGSLYHRRREGLGLGLGDVATAALLDEVDALGV